eukprot:CAMPEP_0113303338 /NCGR_PEP_ID=MMETSP0010_2-20120614/3794_1 /TAXON_ID=216773 ORGANISM="Corethron hystrix, Strain 308" /NCGR_SAMPLE_ID=MMETSP0010_2 /ASSEMBLY_ACC=CAM_ASM_000155 /LENGTH=899 /DNA_ID=CAMNT_0000157315 /DNA_START=111 /DNA_END=2811 /DNA_ORIENTATION=- /assembly_acc=CAM_ASM_000155
MKTVLLLVCLAHVFARARASAFDTTYDCDASFDFIHDISVQKEVCGSASEVLETCRGECDKKGCTAFFYQEHPNNNGCDSSPGGGSQICGFTDEKEFTKAHHGNREGSQICIRVTSSPVPSPVPPPVPSANPPPISSASLTTSAPSTLKPLMYQMKRRSSEKEMLTFDVTNMCGDFFNIKGRPGMQAKCIMYRPVLKPWLEEGKNGIYMAMEKGHEGNPHQVCVLQKLVCESTEKYTEYSPECNIAFGSCRSALRHLHEMMFNKPPSPQICNNFARKSIRGFFHDFMSNAIDGSILAEHDISMNFGLCRWAQYVNVLSDHTLCDPGSIVAMAGELGYLACGVDLFNLDSEVKPRVTLNRPFSCGPNIEQSPLFDHSTLQRREEFSDAQLATNSTAMEEFWYAANSHTHGRPDGEIEYSGESAGAAHAVGRVTCPPDGVTFSGSHQTYKKGFFHIPRGTKNDVQADYHQGIGRLGQTMCAKGQQPQPEGVRPSTPDFPLTDEETDFNAEGGLCSMPTQFLGTVRVGGTHRVPRWVEITEHSSKLWPEWSEYQSKCRSEMPMYIPLELLTISEVELPRSFALDKFQSIAWDSYDSIDSEWDSCEVGCAIPILENRVCGGTNGLSEFDWTLDIAIGAFKMIVAKFAVVLAVINVQKITLPLAVLLMSSRILVVNASVPMTSNASCQEREMELFANPIMIVSRDHVRANVAMLVVLAMNAKNVDLWGGIVLNVKMVSFLKAFLALVNANVLTDASIVIVVSARLVIQPNTFLKMENANLNMVMVRYVKARKNVHLVAAWVDTVVKNQLCILAQNVTVVVNVKCVWEVTPCVVITKKNKDSARKQLVQLSQVFAVALVVLIVIIQVLMATTIVPWPITVLVQDPVATWNAKSKKLVGSDRLQVS